MYEICKESYMTSHCRNMCYVTYQREDVFHIVDGGDTQEILTLATKLHGERFSLQPLLLLATWKDNLATMSTLLSMGAEPTARDQEGRTCLHLAANNDSVPAVKLLLENKVLV